MPDKLKFYVQGSGSQSDTANHLSILPDNWNDYGHVIKFHLFYVVKGGKARRLGAFKVLQVAGETEAPIQVRARTTLPAVFEQLDEHFVSLGQEDDYYQNLHTMLGVRAGEVLEALRDIAWAPQLAQPFEPSSAFRNALMRDNAARRARRFGVSWATGVAVQETFDFSYSCSIPGADGPIDAKIGFDAHDSLPGRVVGIIGRNAVGKTRFLAKLGEDLAQISRTSRERLEEQEKRFPAGRPLFTRIIAISYSAFDRFKRPSSDATSSYVYCGIRDEKGGLSRRSLNEEYRSNRDRIRDLDLQSEWVQYVQDILGDVGDDLADTLLEEINSGASDSKVLAVLSSGQAILCHFVTGLVAWIQPNSLVLFDEPETHLHPNAVANLFLVLADILKKFDSFAIVATHSPVVIQEIPSKRVILFVRSGNTTVAEPLTLESFGESVTELTRHVFETIEVENLYKRTLRSFAKNETAEKTLARFEQGLSLNAQAYLLSQYPNARKKAQ